MITRLQQGVISPALQKNVYKWNYKRRKGMANSIASGGVLPGQCWRYPLLNTRKKFILKDKKTKYR
jgi:hypothetical protein